jgi:hypothetical protein
MERIGTVAYFNEAVFQVLNDLPRQQVQRPGTYSLSRHSFSSNALRTYGILKSEVCPNACSPLEIVRARDLHG